MAKKINDSLANPEALREMVGTRRYDQKTIFFLAQLDEADAMREVLQQILLGEYQANVSENALQLLYWSARIRAGMEEEIADVAKLKAALDGRIPAKANLAVAKLQEITLECAALTDVDFSEADLRLAKLTHTKLADAIFRGTSLVGAQIENASAVRANFREADVDGASFNDSDLTRANFTDARNWGLAKFLRANTGLIVGIDLATLLPVTPKLQDFNPVVQSGPNCVAHTVSYSPNGLVLAAGGNDGIIRVYRAKDGALLRTLEGHLNGVLSVSFSPDSQIIASGSCDKSVKLWQIKSGKEIRSLAGHSNWILSVAFSPDGETLASGSYDNLIKLWQVKSGKEIRSLAGHSGSVNSVLFSPDGETLASGSDDNSVNLWQVKSGKQIRSLDGHSGWVLSVSFSPDGETLASGSDDNSVKLWQVKSGKLLTTLMGNLGTVQAVAFAENGKYLVSAGVAGRLQFWDPQTGETFLYRYSFGPGAWLDLLPDGRFDGSPEGMRYLGYTEDGTLRHYPAESLVKEFHSPEAVQAVLAKYTG